MKKTINKNVNNMPAKNKPITPARRAANKRNTDKRKAEMTAAAKYHGFANWSAMITAIIRREWPA